MITITSKCDYNYEKVMIIVMSMYNCDKNPVQLQ